MPTFPQHRNMKKAIIQKENREQEPTVTDQTNNLPAISDLVCLSEHNKCISICMYVYVHISFTCQYVCVSAWIVG